MGKKRKTDTRWTLAACTVAMAAGPSVMAHLHNAVAVGDTVRLALYLDKSGQGVMIALPQQETTDMADDPMLKAYA